jgi:hypothetical protein
MRRLARNVPGLLAATIFVRRSRTVFLMSLWANKHAMAVFASTVPQHVPAVRWVHHDAIETWSGTFGVLSTSRRSTDWFPQAEVNEAKESQP